MDNYLSIVQNIGLQKLKPIPYGTSGGAVGRQTLLTYAQFNGNDKAKLGVYMDIFTKLFTHVVSMEKGES